MNKFLGYFLIFVCIFMIIVLCIYLGISIDKDIRGGICEKGYIVAHKS